MQNIYRISEYNHEKIKRFRTCGGHESFALKRFFCFVPRFLNLLDLTLGLNPISKLQCYYLLLGYIIIRYRGRLLDHLKNTKVGPIWNSVYIFLKLLQVFEYLFVEKMFPLKFHHHQPFFFIVLHFSSLFPQTQGFPPE